MKQFLNLLCLAASLALAGAARADGAAVAAHQAIPGVSPEPILEGAGLKTPEELESFVDGVMAAHLKAQKTPGATFVVVKDGKIFFAKGYGYADVEKRVKVDPAKTLFRNGSVSKLFTWTALMQLVEQGKVKLDEDVNTYVTQFKVPDTYPGQPITVRNLFTHTEGFEDNSLGWLIVDKAERVETLDGGLANHIPKRVHPPTTDFNTGDNSSYSNWGAALAGLIVQDVSGMPFDDYIEENIFAPLDMKDSTFRQPVPAALAGQLAGGYEIENGVTKRKDFEFVNIWPAGSMSVSATDMGKFMIAHLNGGPPLLKPETAALMHARNMSPSPYLNGTGFGFYENWINGRRLICHAGDLQYFHSDLCLLPEEKVGIFVSYNAAATLGFSARGDLFDAFLDHYYPAKIPQLKAPDGFKDRVANYVGTYRMNRHSWTHAEKVFALGAVAKVAPTDHDTVIMAFGPLAGEFVEVKRDVFRKVDGSQMFAITTAADGKRYLLDPLGVPFIGAYKLGALENPQVLGLVAAFALLCFIVAIVSAIRHWKADGAGPVAARRARRVAALNAVMNLAVSATLGLGIAMLIKAPSGEYPVAIRVACMLGVLTIPLTVALLGFAAVSWKNKWWTGYGRVQYTVIALASVAFLLLLNYTNLVGVG